MGLIFLVFFILSSCSTFEKNFDFSEVQTHEEYDNAIKVEKIPVAPEPQKESADAKKTSPVKATVVSKKETKEPLAPSPAKKLNPPKNSVIPLEKPKAMAPVVAATEKTEVVEAPVIQPKGALAKKVPALEDAEGFNGRRPIEDPFRVGEQVTYSVSYFKVEAGRFDLGVRPFVQVNGRKAYHFHFKIKTSSLFSMFYAVEDVAETFVDYELWRPINYEIHVNETKQIKETKSYFDWKKMRGYLSEKKKVPGKTVEHLKREWDILDWSQNVFSAGFYLRTFQLKVGKTLKVRVGHEGKNLIMSAKVLRKEKLDTPVGRFDTFVIRPTFEVDGIFKPTGDNLLWVTADKRKFILRIESKIKIGTIVSMVKKLKK